MEQMKELERELEGKEEELEKVKKTRKGLARRGQQDRGELDQSREKQTSVFADAELDEKKIVEKDALKEKIKGLEEDIEDIDLAERGLEIREGKLSREVEVLKAKKESQEGFFESYGIVKGEYKVEYEEEKEKEKRRKEGVVYYRNPADRTLPPLRLKRIKLVELAGRLGIQEDLQKFFKGVEKELGKLEGD